MRAIDIMTTKVIAVSPANSVKHAAQLMLDHRISGCLLSMTGPSSSGSSHRR